MKKIISFLKSQMEGADVEDLQAALRRFLNKGFILKDDPEARRELSAKLILAQAAQKFDEATSKLVRKFQEEHGLEVSGVVDEPTANAMNRLLDELGGSNNGQGGEAEFSVKGTVRYFDGFPAPDIIVVAFDRDLRNEEVLGQSRTDRQGNYQIQYSENQFCKAEKRNADLVVKALSASGAVLVASPILFNAPPAATVDLSIPAEATELPTLFERIQRTLQPLLGGVAVAELEEDERHQDISFLSGETGFEKKDLARFVLAHRLEQQQRFLPAEFWFALLGSSIYEFTEGKSLAEQLSTLLDALPSLDAAAVRRALASSFKQKEIAEVFQENVDAWIEAFLQFIAERILSDEKPTFVKLALADAGITGGPKQQKFARLFNQYKTFTPELLDALEEDPSFEKSEIADLRTSFQLTQLTRSDFSVVKVLKEEFNIRRPEQIRPLAKKSEAEWVDLIKTRHAAGVIKLPFEMGAIPGDEKFPDAEVYGKTLAREFRLAFPTTAFSGGLDRALNNGGARGMPHAEALSRFLDYNPEFELLNTPVDDFLKNSDRAGLQELAGDESFRLELKAVQRVFKLVPTFEGTDALLADGLHSAQKVYRMGKSEFVRQYASQPGFTPDTARLAWNRAADTHAAVLTIVADLKGLEAEGLPLALKNNNEALKTFPNWENLFRTGDLCECEHCRSVLGPAAYFADLLMFLKDREASNPAQPDQKVKDVLFARRPDLGFIELNCANALTTLPYIDVVCEVLEDAVDATGENDLEMVGFTAIPADPAAAKAAVAQAFKDAFADPINKDKEKIGLGADFSLSQVDPTNPDSWVMHGDGVTYLLKKKGTANFFAEILRNTKTSAAELRAYPQYVNPKAYGKLRGAKYPSSLPFDLFAEEVRAGFQKSGLQRWDLMRTLRSSTSPHDPSEGDIAAEYFGISSSANSSDPSEKNLILVADPTDIGQQEVWGEKEANWLEVVGNVKNFLDKTGLEYNDLLALLDLEFINPAGDIVVHHRDPSCDAEQKAIQALDAPKLDRIHRFLRLWRKLKGWKMWELDLVIRQPGVGNRPDDEEWQLNEAFLINLFYFSRLKNHLGAKATVEQVCALFGNLNTRMQFTKAHEKRSDGLYQSLFLNKRLINPLDPAFELDPTGELPSGQTITAHHPLVLAALDIREADLLLLKELTNPGGTRYITDNLNLANLSFLWRHAWLSRLLGYNAEDWKILLKIIQQDVLYFADPKMALEFVEKIDYVKNTGFSPDELNWLLAADRDAGAATKETDARKFLATFRKQLQAVRTEYDPVQYDFLSDPADEERLATLLVSLLQQLDRNEAETEAFLNVIRKGTPVAGTPAEMRVKFYEAKFSESLARLPEAIDFAAQLPAELAAKIAYDVEQRLLRFTGIMSSDEQAALLALSPDPDYAAAVNSLAAQPQEFNPPDARVWLTDVDIDATQPGNGTLARRLAKAAIKALNYLSRTTAEKAAVQLTSAQLGLTEALTHRLLTHYAILPETLLARLMADFTIDNSTLNGWYWANRVAAIWKKWKITLTEWELIIALTGSAELLDFAPPSLPLEEAKPFPALDQFLRTSRLLRLRDSLPEKQSSLLEVLEKLNTGEYADKAAFAADVERLYENWPAADVEALTTSLDLTYPAKFLLAENWERLRRVFYFLGNLNASAGTVQSFAAAAMTPDHAKTLNKLLHSKLGADTWLTLSAEIQDVLRERKRDALATWLLTQTPPADAPSEKWENMNDLYAYYLLDIEMSSCLLTSRLVQASGSVQLFVQRCFMGLESNVKVKAEGDDGDSEWRWWTWMRKYRVWEANRKVFLWPENWIEPELKKDRSPFFKDMENELLQNEINQYTVETAFSNYLEKLGGVAQLEIAGFYQEDDGDDTIIHVFGRNTGAEPHLYYYRRYDYRQWTPWEKMDLDIQGDLLIPAVINKRLFLFWPVFTEVTDEKSNAIVNIPEGGEQNTSLPPVWKRLRMQMAASEYRQGKWTPKRTSKDYFQSNPYPHPNLQNLDHFENSRKESRFLFIDRSDRDNRVGIQYETPAIGAAIYGPVAAFEIFKCEGAPESARFLGDFRLTFQPEMLAVGIATTNAKWKELDPRGDDQNDFTLHNNFAAQPDTNSDTEILRETPGLFKISPGWHLSYFDRMLLTGPNVVLPLPTPLPTPVGVWLPYFYNDEKRTFFVLPLLEILLDFPVPGTPSSVRLYYPELRLYYPELKKIYRDEEDHYEDQVEAWLDTIDPSSWSPSERQYWEQYLHQYFPEESLPYEPDQIKNLIKRLYMRGVRYELGTRALPVFHSPLRLFHFKNFYHPFVCEFAKLVYNPLKGIPALMSRETQFKNTRFKFFNTYQPQISVLDYTADPNNPHSKYYPQEIVDFSSDGAYSSYNWELFFHAPLLVANSLSKNQRFEEARDWYHFIFNPLGVESSMQGGSEMSKYWITKPFFETTDPEYIRQRIDHILRMLAGDTSVPDYSAEAKKELEDQVLDWRRNPFEPHRIANYRTVAYQKTVVMKYLDNLIAWGDNLFRQDSMESINEATQLYILAAEILGPRPRKIPPQAKPAMESFNELESEFDKFSNALVEVENLVPVLPGDEPDGGDPAPLPMLYFCIPQNDKMLGYWDTVADRLYKIRHCMNIEGVVRQLALFEPPIDPGALVKAVAGGVDIGSALADLNVPLSLYRFNILLQKANEVCNDVKALGGALLAALEKKDAEALGLLRQEQEIKVLEAVKAVRERQIEEAKENLEGLKKSRNVVETRRDYYANNAINNLIPGEQQNLNKLGIAQSHQNKAQIINIAASILGYYPNLTFGGSGFGGSPHVTVQWGTGNIISALQAAAGSETQLGSIASYEANRALTLAGYERRLTEWNFQVDMAVKELDQVDTSIAAAELRMAIAEKELENHILQIENAKATDAFMRSKYTNQELYQWQVGEISNVYFQSYRLAYDLAKRAERCFRFELGLQDSSYISFGYWDSLKKGLLAGEKLQYDLRRLETAYLEQNRREFELTKHVSLVLHQPRALVQLRETGRCLVDLPEEIFDLDYPGHYFRRIKSVSITLPCVVGPYTAISCTLRLLRNSIRINTALTGENGYPRNPDSEDDRFIENNIPVKAIAASNAQNDSGVFELNFRDERYLPFEGAGVISRWSLELFNDSNPGSEDFGKPLRQFDYETISDAILHIKYTAREDAGQFKNEAIGHLRSYFQESKAAPSLRMFDLRQEFPTQWHRFLHPVDSASGNVFELEMSPERFRILDRGKTLTVNTIWLLARCTKDGNYNVSLAPPLEGSDTLTLARSAEYGGLHINQKGVGLDIDPAAPPVTWLMKMTNPAGENLEVDPAEVGDVLLIVGYTWKTA
ncbi:neuraminidase-like domain-containing protein [Nitrosospira multiformis]|uniref:Virulence plasmid A protein n=1 Tax=Nitrosospira multiformis TaxID=1231 RepID=A0A1I7FSI3_9PROT|nr:neuraminidase-like domain-containing protein [Nitrosospira multiformis]SFU39127.1 virulence plasmid A protein [Nitrosospira multiformis]